MKKYGAELVGTFWLVLGGCGSAVLAAAPHGVSHTLLDSLLARTEAAGARPAVVDISADFRFADLAEYERVYKHPHGAPARAKRSESSCAAGARSALAKSRTSIRLTGPRPRRVPRQRRA